MLLAVAAVILLAILLYWLSGMVLLLDRRRPGLPDHR